MYICHGKGTTYSLYEPLKQFYIQISIHPFTSVDTGAAMQGVTYSKKHTHSHTHTTSHQLWFECLAQGCNNMLTAGAEKCRIQACIIYQYTLYVMTCAVSSLTAVTCDLAPIPPFGMIVYDKRIRGNTVDYGVGGTYKCNPPYIVFGNARAECTVLGNWTKTPECQGMKVWKGRCCINTVSRFLALNLLIWAITKKLNMKSKSWL